MNSKFNGYTAVKHNGYTTTPEVRNAKDILRRLQILRKRAVKGLTEEMIESTIIVVYIGEILEVLEQFIGKDRPVHASLEYIDDLIRHIGLWIVNERSRISKQMFPSLTNIRIENKDLRNLVANLVIKQGLKDYTICPVANSCVLSYGFKNVVIHGDRNEDINTIGAQFVPERYENYLKQIEENFGKEFAQFLEYQTNPMFTTTGKILFLVSMHYDFVIEVKF